VTPDDQLDLFRGRGERDRGMAVVAGRAELWTHAAAAALLRNRVTGLELSADRLRQIVTEAVGPPHHANAWGAFFNSLVRGGMLEKTGRMVASARVTNHAREVRVYRWR
jgi:hypothetical protein